MKFGVCLPNYGPGAAADAIPKVATAAEAAGFDSVWTTDHVLVPAEHAASFGRVVESLVTLGYVAGITETLTLATSILVLPQRDPLLAAKQIAAIDQLSGGRVAVGVGIGWMKREYEFLRTDFHQRGRIADEWIRVMRTLWTEEAPAFHGEWIEFDDAVFEPKPVQPGGPLIYVGGNSDAAIRRAATLGDGWHADGLSPAALADGVAKLRDWAGDRPMTVSLRGNVTVGQEGEGFESSSTGVIQDRIGGSPQQMIDTIGALSAAGLDHLVCYFVHDTADEVLSQLDTFGAEVIPALRS